MLSRGDEQRCGCAGELALAPRERLSLPFPSLPSLSLPGNREPGCSRRGPGAELVIGGERKGPGGEERGRVRVRREKDGKGRETCGKG